jgi:outer membrane protein OmpA-like peptidoglycan-associated protein
VTDEIRAVGYGKTRLVVPNASKDQPGADQNRRVVFVVESAQAAATGVAMSSQQ